MTAMFVPRLFNQLYAFPENFTDFASLIGVNPFQLKEVFYFRNRNLLTYKVPLESQAQVTSLFTSAASNQSGCPNDSPWKAPSISSKHCHQSARNHRLQYVRAYFDFCSAVITGVAYAEPGYCLAASIDGTACAGGDD